MNDRPSALARVLSLRDLIAIVFGTVIGSGVFIIPGTVLREVGARVDVSLTVWVIGGVLSLLGALTYGELGAMQPEAGGLYVYIRDAFGSLPAFLYGWSLFFVIGSGSAATLAVASTLYLGKLIPLNALATHLVPLVVIALCAILNVRGTRQSATVTTWLTVTKIVAIAGMTIALLAVGRAPGAIVPPAPAPMSGLALFSASGLAMIATLWAYEGWQYVTFSAGETRDPQRTFPRGIIIGTAGIVVLYLLANVAYIRVLGGTGVAQSDRVAADAVGAAFGPAAAAAIAIVADVLCNGARWCVLPAARRSPSAVRDTGVRDPDECRMGDAAGGHRYLRAAADVRDLQRLDFLWTGGPRCVLVSPASPGDATALSRARLPRDTRAVRSLGARTRDQYDVRATAAGRDRTRHRAARRAGVLRMAPFTAW
jgi:APA family basic amino acid/polyamine antiporter